MSKLVQNAKAVNTLKSWFNWALACIRNPNSRATNAREPDKLWTKRTDAKNAWEKRSSKKKRSLKLVLSLVAQMSTTTSLLARAMNTYKYNFT